MIFCPSRSSACSAAWPSLPEDSRSTQPKLCLPPTTEIDALEGVTSLVDKNLLRQGIGPNDEPRFAMLETIREFGLEQLAAAGEVSAARDAHAAYYLALAREANSEWGGPRTGYWQMRGVLDFDNARTMIAWLEETGDAASALAFVTSVSNLWNAPSRFREGIETVERLLATDANISSAVRASAMAAAGSFALSLQDVAEAARFADAALSFARQSHDHEALIAALQTKGCGRPANAGTLQRPSAISRKRWQSLASTA